MANFLVTLIDRLSGGKLSAQFREAYTSDNMEDADAYLYRRLTSLQRDLMPMQFKRAQDLSFSLWQRNPLARRMIDIVVQFCSGDDFRVELNILKSGTDGQPEKQEDASAEAQEIWNQFARDPVNRLEQEMPMLVQDFVLFGELALPVTVRSRTTPGGEEVAGDGLVRFGYIDPGNISEVEVNPKNIREVRSITVGATPNGIKLAVVSPDTNPTSPTYERLTGEVIYYRLNRVANQTRGTGFLVEHLDWLDLLDQFVFEALRGFQARNTFFWSVKMTGLSEAQIEARKSSFQPPQTGAARLHNENVEYNAVAPDLKAQDIERALLSMETFIIGSKGFPLTWFGTGESSNRASAEAMAVPTLKMLQSMQRHVRNIVKELAQFVIDQAVIAGRMDLEKGEYLDTTVYLHDLNRRDASVIAAGFQQVVAALTVARQNAWVSDETAKQVVDSNLTLMGIEVPADEDVETLKEEREEEKQENIEKMYDQAGPPPGGEKQKKPVEVPEEEEAA